MRRLMREWSAIGRIYSKPEISTGHHINTESAARHEEVIQPLRLSATGLTVERR